MSFRRRLVVSALIVVAITGGLGAFVAYRSVRLYHTAKDFRTEIRYLLDTGGTIGEAPAAETFGTDFLDAMFGSDPQLLQEVKAVIARGLFDDPSLNLGEVAAFIVTYHRNSSGNAEDVIAYAAGGFPLGKRKPGFHKDGYFSHQMDDRLWLTGNTMLAFLGRDIVVFSKDDNATRDQEELLESLLTGDILPLAAKIINRPLFYQVVIPDPSRVVPPQMRKHVQAVMIKGHLSGEDGSIEHIVLAQSPESANYVLSLMHDSRMAAMIWLRTKMKGQYTDTAWGPSLDMWWSYEFANALEAMTFEKEQGIVRTSMKFQRVMVNAVLKCIERMGRDMWQMRGSLDERMDPRLVDARMKSTSPLHYWSSAHRWGPDWPIAAPTNETTDVDSAPSESSPAVSQPL